MKMLPKFISIIAICMFSNFLSISSHAEEQLILSIYKRNPWLMVIGSDSPYINYYSNGDIIFTKTNNEEQPKYYTVNIDGTPEQEILNSYINEIKQRTETIVLSDATDQTTFEFHILDKGDRHTFSIYGNIEEEKRQAELDLFKDMYKQICTEDKSSEQCMYFKERISNPINPPEDIVKLWNFLTATNWKNAVPWKYKYIEVMVWSYENSVDKSIKWPKKFPDTKHPNTIKRREGQYSIFLPVDQRPAFLKFIKKRKERGAVLINGKKMAVSTRIPFPNETNYPKEKKE